MHRLYALIVATLALAAGCSRPEGGKVPAPNAAEAPRWTGDRAAQPPAKIKEQADEPPGKQLPGLPGPLRGVRYSKDKPLYDMPVVFQIDAPQVPAAIQNPSPPIPEDLKKKKWSLW